MTRVVFLASTNEIARIDRANADAAVDGRADGRVVEPRLREFHVRFVLSNVRPVLADQHPLLIGLLLSGKVVLQQFFVAPQIGFRILKLNGRAIALAPAPVEPGLINRRVDVPPAYRRL